MEADYHCGHSGHLSLIHILRIDKEAQEYYAQLTAFYQQFRRIGNNYNQCVKTIHTIYGDVYKRQEYVSQGNPTLTKKSLADTHHTRSVSYTHLSHLFQSMLSQVLHFWSVDAHDVLLSFICFSPLNKF